MFIVRYLSNGWIAGSVPKSREAAVCSACKAVDFGRLQETNVALIIVVCGQDCTAPSNFPVFKKRSVQDIAEWERQCADNAK